MKGANKLFLNEETVCQAIQFWLHSWYTGQPLEVQSVSLASDHNFFEVVIAEKKAKL